MNRSPPGPRPAPYPPRPPSREVQALDTAQESLARVKRQLAELEYPEARSWVAVGGVISRDEQRAEALLAELQAERPLRREAVRTSFDDVYPGMPPALRLSA